MTLSDNEIKQIIDEFLNMTTERQYIGARYVPIFGRKDEDSILWDNTAPYEPLTIVLYQGNSYTSRQYVPIGVDIANEEFWANTGNYNAQIEQYRQETQRVQEELDNLEFYSIKPFDTVDDMVNDDDLQVGMICHTNGFYAAGDDGAAFYKITATGTANGMDVISCGNLYAYLIPENPFNASQIGCIGENATAENIAYALTNDCVVFNSDIATDTEISISGSNKSVEFKNITSTAANALKVSGSYNNVVFKKINNANGKGIIVDCTSEQTMNTSITGEWVNTSGDSVYINCHKNGFIWSEITITRLFSSGGKCINMLCNASDDNTKPSFIGQVKVNVLQMQATTDWAVYGLCKADNATITGLHFTQTAIENSKGGFYFEAESGTYCEIKMVEIEKCRAYEQGFTNGTVTLKGLCFYNRFEFDSPIYYTGISASDCTEQSYTRANIITGGIFSPTNFNFANTAAIYKGKIILKDSTSNAVLKSSVSRMLYDTSDPNNAGIWRVPKYYYNDSGNTVTITNISNITPDSEIIVSQNQSNGSIVILKDAFDNTMFDGSTLTSSTRKYYRITPRNNFQYCVCEINDVTNMSTT